MDPNRRLHELDSLRGIAAITVMISHLLLVYPVVWNSATPEDAPLFWSIFLFSPLRIMFAGHEAVIFFFVLSGYVLSLPFLNGSMSLTNYPAYAAKRIIRIYPPYAAASILAFIAYASWSSHHPTGVSDWFHQSWRTPLTLQSITDHLFMVGSFDNCAFNPVLWSLVHEMRISLIFPFLVWAIMKKARWTILAAFLFTAIDWASVSLRFRGIIHFEHDYFMTLRYSAFFIVGSILAKHSNQIFGIISPMGRMRKFWLAILGIFAYTNPFWLPHWFCSHGSTTERILTKPWIQEWITCGGVIVFIALSTCTSRASRFLNTPMLFFLGSISYSLYLFHAVVLKSIVCFFGESAPLPILLSACAIVSVFAAWLGWIVIERPSIRIGKSVSAFFIRTGRECS